FLVSEMRIRDILFADCVMWVLFVLFWRMAASRFVPKKQDLRIKKKTMCLMVQRAALTEKVVD
ncbi:MAG: hypothetical protein K2H04_01755, partial [Bacteroidaceae bacterium]|nr:hypothetical protein [Bacteroidaceae bacterium]